MACFDLSEINLLIWIDAMFSSACASVVSEALSNLFETYGSKFEKECSRTPEILDIFADK